MRRCSGLFVREGGGGGELCLHTASESVSQMRLTHGGGGFLRYTQKEEKKRLPDSNKKTDVDRSRCGSRARLSRT